MRKAFCENARIFVRRPYASGLGSVGRLSGGGDVDEFAGKGCVSLGRNTPCNCLLYRRAWRRNVESVQRRGVFMQQGDVYVTTRSTYSEVDTHSLSSMSRCRRISSGSATGAPAVVVLP